MLWRAIQSNGSTIDTKVSLGLGTWNVAMSFRFWGISAPLSLLWVFSFFQLSSTNIHWVTVPGFLGDFASYGVRLTWPGIWRLYLSESHFLQWVSSNEVMLPGICNSEQHTRDVQATLGSSHCNIDAYDTAHMVSGLLGRKTLDHFTVSWDKLSIPNLRIQNPKYSKIWNFC